MPVDVAIKNTPSINTSYVVPTWLIVQCHHEICVSLTDIYFGIDNLVNDLFRNVNVSRFILGGGRRAEANGGDAMNEKGEERETKEMER